jgi:hypothetical protein
MRAFDWKTIDKHGIGRPWLGLEPPLVAKGTFWLREPPIGDPELVLPRLTEALAGSALDLVDHSHGVVELTSEERSLGGDGVSRERTVERGAGEACVAGAGGQF